MLQQYLQVGVITATHGLKGEVKVYPTTDQASRFDRLEEVLVASDAGLGGQTLRVEGVRYFKNLVIVKLEGIDRIEDASGILKKNLYVTREDAVPLEESQYYVADLYGMTVVTEEGRTLGQIKDVLVTGANDVYVVSRADAKGKELLLPAIKDCIRKVDLPENVMTVHLLDGLMQD